MSKYKAKRTTVDNITFDSMKEARRYQELLLLQRAGEIHALELQPSWELHAGSLSQIVGKYRGDFLYCECEGGKRACNFSRPVVEDVKGFKTPLYRWKAKHMKAEYSIQIRET